MPNFIFPLLYRNRALQQHKIVMMTESSQLLITGGECGELVFWKGLEPMTIVYPNLSNAYGSLISMHCVRIPLYRILDRGEECVLTIHGDRRVRIFDCRDGRCLGVSMDVLQVQWCLPLSPQNCRFLLLASTSGLNLFDLWKMKIVKDYLCKVRAFCKIDANTVALLDEDNILHIINLSPLNNERFLNFKEYQRRKEKVKQDFKEMKLCDGLIMQKIEGIGSNRIRHMSYNTKLQHLSILTHRNLYLVFDVYQTNWSLCVHQSKNNQKFNSLTYSEEFLYINTRNGSVLPIRYDDLLYLLDKTKEQSDFVYGFREFQFTKIAGTRMSRVQLNFQEIISGSQDQKNTNGILILNEKVYQYKDEELRLLNLKDVKIELSLFSNGGEIKFRDFDRSINTECDLVKSESFQGKAPPIDSYKFSYNRSLLNNLQLMTTTNFQKKYNLNKVLSPDIMITCAFINVNECVYWFGCNDGCLYGFPLQNSKTYFIYKVKLDGTAITFIYHKDKYLLASAESGLFAVVSSESFQNEGLAEKLIEIVEIEPISRVYLPSSARKVIRIHRLQNESYEEQSAPSQEKYSQLAILMENIILIVSNGLIKLKLHGINQQVLGLYHEQEADHWFVVLGNGEALVYDFNGRYVRTIKIESYHSLFQVEKKLQILKEKMVGHHNLNEFNKEFNKSISETYCLLEFQQRNNYIKLQSPYPSLYEVGGMFKTWTFEQEQAPKMLYLIDHNQVKSNTHMCKFVETSIGEMEWWDLKMNHDFAQQSRFFALMHPWDVEPNPQLDQFLNYQRPTFSPLLGIQSMGYAISFSLKRGWSTSSYLTSQRAMSLMHYYLTFLSKESQLFNQLMIQTVELLTKKKDLLDPQFQPMDIFLLAQYTIDESNEVMNAACNLILSQIRKSDQDMGQLHKIVRELLELHDITTVPAPPFSNVEVILLMLESYISGLTGKEGDLYKGRVIQGLSLKNCIVNPHLCAPLLKVFVDVQQHFRNAINPGELFKNLFFVFFHYNTAIEYQDALQQSGQQMINVLREIAKQPDEMKKRMRQLTVKSIIQVAISHSQEFLNILRKDIVNLETHLLYPSAIIEIIRSYIKSQHNNINKQLPFLMEVILKSLDPNNPNLRKVCHRSATYALHTICKTFKCVCFHQQTQKIAIGDTQIIIYDLRTAVKWRVLDGHTGQVNCLEFDHNGKQLASFSETDWKIKIWKVGSTGFFGAIIGIQGKPQKDFNVRQQILQQVTIQWQQDDSKVFLMQNGQTVVQCQV